MLRGVYEAQLAGKVLANPVEGSVDGGRGPSCDQQQISLQVCSSGIGREHGSNR